MNFISTVFSKVQESLSLSANFTVTEVTQTSLDQANLIAGEGDLELLKYGVETDCRYALILSIKSSKPKTYRLFLIDNEEEAMSLYRVYHSNLLPMLSVSQNISGSTRKLQELCNAVRCQKEGCVVHVCVDLGFIQVLQSKHPDVVKCINVADEEGSTPLHVACKSREIGVDFVSQLVCLGADLSLRDAHGETPITLCARYSPEKLKALLGNPTDAVNSMTIFGETAVHIACLEDQPECLEILLNAGADPMVSESHQLPIHCAVRSESVKCIELLVEKCPELITAKDTKFGGTALHWAKTKEVVDCLLLHGAHIDAVSNTGDTPLHIMLRNKRKVCVAALLVKGADVSIPNAEGETPLHIAIKEDDKQTAMGLIIHGADVNMKDRNGISLRHLASTLNKPNSAEILYMLHKIGSLRCKKGQKDCADGCKFDGKYRGKKFGFVDKEKEAVERECDEILTSGSKTNQGANSKVSDSVGSSKDIDNGGNGYCESIDSGSLSSPDSVGSDMEANVQVAVEKAEDAEEGYRILTLDGGGIRGMILAVTLMKLETMLEGNIVDYFDWISGTSTGGMLALGLAHGMDARYCLGLYLRLKNHVFSGSKPYSAEHFETILQQEFGPDTLMTALKKPKVIVTAVLADRHPPDLYLFKNYENPLDSLIPLEKRLSPCHSQTTKPADMKVWEAARSSGAAPTYFRAGLNKFLDGGLMANNPTLDTLTEIYEYNAALKAMNKSDLVKPIKCVISLGTGRIPKCTVCDIDVFRPSGLMEAYKVMQGAQSLMRILVEQATQSEGRPNERARAWCASIGAHFFRLSPQLSEDILLDETDDDKLLMMCWETLVYLHRNRDRLQKIVNILKPNRGKADNPND